jgi:hypothetical protein
MNERVKPYEAKMIKSLEALKEEYTAKSIIMDSYQDFRQLPMLAFQKQE